MIKLLVIAGVVLLVAGGAGAAVYFYQEVEPSFSEAELLALESADAKSPSSGSSEPVVAVTVLSGSVEVTLPDGAQKTITGKTTVPVSSTIKTDADSRALLEFPDGSNARIDAGTEVKILELKKGASTVVSLRLTVGRIFSRVKSLLGGSRYEVRTSNTIAAVRGTGFDVSFKGGKTQVTTVEHRIEVTALDPETGDPIPGVPVTTVDKGKRVTLDESDPPTSDDPPQVEEVKEEDAWLAFNEEEEGRSSDEPVPEEEDNDARQLDEEPSPAPERSPSPTPRVSETPRPTPTPTPAPTATPKPTPSPTPAPVAAKLSITQFSPDIVDPRLDDFPILIFGTGFKVPVQVSIGNIRLKNVIVRSSAQISADVPRGTAPGAYDLTLENGDGEKLVVGGGFFGVALFGQ